MFSPAVVTSKKADEHHAKILGEHADLLNGMRDQSIRVQQYNEQKAAMQANIMAVQGEMEQAKLASNTDLAKHSMDSALKREELSIKRTALSST